MSADIAQARAQAVESNDLIFQRLGHDRLPLLYYLWFKASQPVTRSVDFKVARGCLYYLFAFAIFSVSAGAFFLIEVAFYLALQDRVDHVLKKGRKSAIFAIQGFTSSELFLYFLLGLFVIERLLFFIFHFTVFKVKELTFDTVCSTLSIPFIIAICFFSEAFAQ